MSQDQIQRQDTGAPIPTDLPTTSPATGATGTFHITNEQGDSEFSWNAADDAEIAAAREHFASLRGKGMLLYRVDGEERVQMQEFEPDARRIVAVPPSQGG